MFEERVYQVVIGNVVVQVQGYCVDLGVEYWGWDQVFVEMEENFKVLVCGVKYFYYVIISYYFLEGFQIDVVGQWIDDYFCVVVSGLDQVQGWLVYGFMYEFCIDCDKVILQECVVSVCQFCCFCNYFYGVGCQCDLFYFFISFGCWIWVNILQMWQ